MADFLTLKRLEEKITDIIFHAKQNLLILSPYIKLDDYFKKLFSQHIKNPEVRIIILFGKNEDNKGKSLRKEDFEFFKQFPNISILYLKDLHAKYYANEAEGIVTSINLHDYSFKNNIEFGIWSKNPEQSLLGGLATVKNPFSDSLDSTAWEYATGFMKKAEAVFIKRPVIQKKLLGFSKNHMGSEVCYDNTGFFTQGAFGNNKTAEKKTFDDFPDFIEYGKASFERKPRREDVVVEEVSKPNLHHIAYSNQAPSQGVKKGYCIRKGEPIKFNPGYPYSEAAYNVWRQWGNEDYVENFCHSCGKPHPTTKRRPLCDDCFYN